MMKCLVLGANGQDGSYLCEHLHNDGAEVIGVGRSASWRYSNPVYPIKYLCGDLRDANGLQNVLHETAPDEIYHFAAVHGPAGFNYETRWADVLDVNVKSLYVCLEYARQTNPHCRIFYPSSAKVFGARLPRAIDLNTPRVSTCLYSNSKIAAENLLRYYRDSHAVNAVIGYLFNHESPRRGEAYFVPRLADILRSALTDRSYRGELYTLDFYCDWSLATDVVHLAKDHLRSVVTKDLIYASGVTHYARDVARKWFDQHGLDYRAHIKEVQPEAQGENYVADIAATVTHLGRTCGGDILKICDEMLTATP